MQNLYSSQQGKITCVKLTYYNSAYSVDNYRPNLQVTTANHRLGRGTIHMRRHGKCALVALTSHQAILLVCTPRVPLEADLFGPATQLAIHFSQPKYVIAERNKQPLKQHNVCSTIPTLMQYDWFKRQHLLPHLKVSSTGASFTTCTSCLLFEVFGKRVGVK